MKKLLLSAAVVVLGLTSVNAQDKAEKGGFSEGDIFISGTVGYSNWKQAEAKTNQLEVSPSVGYFISDNIALELGVTVGSMEDANDNKINSFGGQLGASYFFTPDSQFSFMVGAGFGYQSQKLEPNGGTESTIDGFAFSVSPGLNYFVSDCFALRASIGALSYASSKADVDGAEAANQFDFNLDLSDINFGVTYKF